MSESKMSVDKWGDKIWRNSNRDLHRTDGPAIEYSNGGKEWWVRGKCHRTDGPAVERSDGGKEWWVRGKCHRTDGPAVELSNGYKKWCVRGKCHRLDGPAVEYSNGHKEWWVEGKRLGNNEEGFWALWDSLSDEDRANPTLLSYLPGDFNV
jgi:hypothetical protein